MQLFSRFWFILTSTLMLIWTLFNTLLFIWTFVFPRYKRENLVKSGMRLWSAGIIKFYLIKLSVLGKENIPPDRKGYIILCNHISLLDIPILGSQVGLPFIMKWSLLANPIGWGAYMAGSIPVKRSNQRSRKEVIEQTIRMCQESISMIVFPEGTRSKTGELGNLKRGLLARLYENNIPIVVSGIWGTQAFMPAHSYSVHYNCPVAISFSPQVHPQDFETFEEFLVFCRDGILSNTAQAKELTVQAS